LTVGQRQVRGPEVTGWVTPNLFGRASFQDKLLIQQPRFSGRDLHVVAPGSTIWLRWRRATRVRRRSATTSLIMRSKNPQAFITW